MDRPLRLATYNIHHGAPRGRAVDHRGLVAACRSLDADVLALQEVDRRAWRTHLVDQPGRVARHLGMHVFFGPNITLGPLGRYGNALLTRGRLLSVEHLALPTAAGLERRGAIVARTSIGDGELAVVATHLSNRGRADRHPALAQLDAVLDRLATIPPPRVLLGDLNLEPDVVGEVVAAAGLVRVDAPPTFPVDVPRRRIDWIAVDGLVVESAEVPALDASDHRPLVAICEVV